MKTIETKTWYGKRIIHDFSAEIERGVWLLDRRVPGWVDDIDLDMLSLSSFQRCILGQLARCRGWGLSPNAYFRAEVHPGIRVGSWFGFTLSHDDTAEIGLIAEILLFRKLTQQWKQKITQLRADRQARKADYMLAAML